MFIYDLNLYASGIARGKMEWMIEGKQSSLQHTTENPQFERFAVKDHLNAINWKQACYLGKREDICGGEKLA